MSDRPSNKFMALLKAGSAAVTLALAGCASQTVTQYKAPEKADEDRHVHEQRELAKQRSIPSGPVSPYVNWDPAQRLGNIASRVMIAGAPYCGTDVKTTYNLQLGTPDNNAPVIMGAGNSRLQAGDRLVSVGGAPVGKGKAGLQGAFAQRERYASANQPMPVEALRGNQRIQATLDPVKACSYPVNLVNNNQWNAFADGKAVHVELKLLRETQNDDDVSFALSHEVAHNAAKHMNNKRTNVTLGALAGLAVDVLAASQGIKTNNMGMKAGAQMGAGAYSVDMERDADKLGMYIHAGTGYDLDAGVRMAQRMGVMAAQKNPDAITRTTTHPATGNRAATLEDVQQEIQTKRATGKPLSPN